MCLGHQCDRRRVRRQDRPGAAAHARQDQRDHHHDGEGVFAGLPKPFTVNRYHSLAIEKSSCPAELAVTAWTDDGEIMGVRHKELAIEGVQFHPESILTEHGHAMLKNFLEDKR